MVRRCLILLALLWAFTGYSQNQRMASLFVSGGTTTAVFRATSTATFAGGGLSSGGWTNSNHLRNASAWVETTAGITNRSATPTRQDAPLLLNGGFAFSPKLIATVGAVLQDTNVYQWWTTNADFSVLYGGTPLDGARGQFDIKNTAATNITVTWPVSWSIAQAKLVSTFTAISNAITEVFWYYEGGSNRVRVATKEIVQNFLSPAAGQTVAFHDPNTFTNLNSGFVASGNDPDVASEGVFGWDANGDVLRGYDGTTQIAVGRKIEAIHVTVVLPNDLADSERDAFWVWSNESGMSFIVTGWKGWSDTDDTTLNIEEIDADGQNNATVDAVEIATNGTGLFSGSDTTITGATIENGHILVLDFDDTDTPGQVKMTIYGYYAADVN